MCITRIIGIGINSCADPTSNGVTYDLTYTGKWVLGTRPGCGSALAPFDPDGQIHPAHAFSSVISLTYEGCVVTIDPNQPCDCVNGGCVPKTTYRTPGVFPNLAACQAGCATNSNCTGECVDPAEIAAHRQALNTLQSKFCR